MNKRGLMNLRQKLVSFVLGIVCVVAGLLVIVKDYLYDIPFLSGFFFGDLFVKIMLVVGGGFLFYDSFKIGHGLSRLVSLLSGVLVLFIGFIPLLIHFKLLGFLPFFATLDIPLNILRGILIFFGVYLVVDAFVMSSKEER